MFRLNCWSGNSLQLIAKLPDGGKLHPDLRKLLTAAGCHFVCLGKGDHDIWFSPQTGIYFPVDSKIKSRHTANAVFKQAGLKKHF